MSSHSTIISFFLLLSEEYNDVITLQTTNSQLAEELQESRDRLYQIQKDKKIEVQKLGDKNTALGEELKLSRAEAQKYREEVARMRKTCAEAGEKERDLKLSLESLETARQVNRDLKQHVEEEQELSFNLSIKQKKDHDEILQLRMSVATTAVMYKEVKLQSEAELVKEVIDYRLEQAGRAVHFLMSLNGGPAAKKLESDLNQFVASLLASKDEVDQLLVEKCRDISRPESLPSLDFDMRKIELPAVGSELGSVLLSLSAPPPAPYPPSFGYGQPPPPHLPSRSSQAAGLPPPGMPGLPQFLSRDRPLSGTYRSHEVCFF